MSQLLSALKTIDQTVHIDVETVAPPESSPSVELPDGPDIVWPPDEPAVAIEEDEPAAQEEVRANDEAKPDASSQPAQASSEPSPFSEATTTRVTVPRVPATFTADAETLRLCDRILSQTPDDRSATIGLFRTAATRSSHRVVGQLAAAVSLRTGQPVLVIDADWRTADRPPVVAGDGPPGLGEVLSEELNWSDAIVEVGQLPAKVSFLGPGRRMASPAAGSRFGPLIDEVRPHYRYILIDGGRVAGSLAAEIACCDRAYLVLGLDQTDRREALATASALGGAGLDVAGCILTYAA